MSNNTQRFEDLAQRVSDMVSDLPNDGKERTMTVTVGGDNHGNITNGNHIVINTNEPKEAEQKPLTRAEMQALEQQARVQRRSALFRSYINLPSMLVLLFMAVTAIALLKGYLWQIVLSTPYPWLVPLVFGAVIFPLAIWSVKIKELERPIFNEATETLRQIQHTRHRQRVL